MSSQNSNPNHQDEKIQSAIVEKNHELSYYLAFVLLAGFFVFEVTFLLYSKMGIGSNGQGLIFSGLTGTSTVVLAVVAYVFFVGGKSKTEGFNPRDLRQQTNEVL